MINAPARSKATLSTCPLCQGPMTQHHAELSLQREVADFLNRGPASQVSRACPACLLPAIDQLRAKGQLKLRRGSLPTREGPRFHPLALAERTLADDGRTGRGVCVAMLDSGFFPHPDLTSPKNRIRGHGVIDDKAVALRTFGEVAAPWPDRFPPPARSWHGLMTSAALAGSGQLSDGVFAGLAEDAELFLVRVGARNGKIGDRQIAEGLRFVMGLLPRIPFRVLSLSVGGDRPIPSSRSSVNKLVRRLTRLGVTVVAAIGNSGARRVVPPASAPEAITVGGLDDRNSLDSADWRIWHSNYGPTSDGLAKPDLIAQSLWVPAPILPGTEVDTEAALLEALLPQSAADRRTFLRAQASPAWRRWADFDAPTLERWLLRRLRRLKLIHRHYQHVEGTSFAAPLVAGTVARMLEEDPSLQPAAIKSILKATALPLVGVSPERQGAGALRTGPAVAFTRRAKVFPSNGPSPWIDGRRVTFHHFAPGATSVHLHAEWRGFEPQGIAFVRVAGPVFRLSLPLPPKGRWRYKLAIDQGPWIRDPENPAMDPDGYGGWNSVLLIS